MKNRITGGAAYVPLGTTANKQGRIAGGNLAGEHETFKGVLGSMVTKAFDLYISATGLSLDQAKAAGYDAVSSIITKGDRASYYPGSRDNTICLILDKKTGRLLGAQAIGSESVAGRINVVRNRHHLRHDGIRNQRAGSGLCPAGRAGLRPDSHRGQSGHEEGRGLSHAGDF